MKKRGIIGFLTAAMVMMVPISVSAAPELMEDGTVFDAEYYAENNPDVTAAFGYDAAALYAHYQAYGRLEGRQAFEPGADVVHRIIFSQYGWHPIWDFLDDWFDWGMAWRQTTPYENEWERWNYVAYNQSEEQRTVNPVETDAEREEEQESETGQISDEFRRISDMMGFDIDEDGELVLRKPDLGRIGITSDMSDMEKARRAHDYLCDNHTYGEETTDAIGRHVDRYVCHYYSCDFRDICEAAGLEAEYLLGTVHDGESHAWNRVKIDGTWYYMDVTWDDCYRDAGFYDDPWYMLSYDEMSEDHRQE